MKPFPGYPSRPAYVAIPRVFFSDVLPGIEDMAELLVTLQLFRLLGAKRGYPRAVPLNELIDDRALAAGFTQLGRNGRVEAQRGLEEALNRGTVLRAEAPDGQAWLLLNSVQDKRAADAIRRGELTPAGGRLPQTPVPVALPQRDIFTLYEENIGLLTPLMAERLQEAEQEYPALWVQEAFQIASENNARSWSYVEAILQRWKSEGRDDGTSGGYPKKERTYEEKYFSGPYGQLFNR